MSADPFGAFDRPAMPAQLEAAPEAGARRRPSPVAMRFPADVDAALDELAGRQGTKVAVVVAAIRLLERPEHAGIRAEVMAEALDYARANRRR
jgi:hypothetical protein